MADTEPTDELIKTAKNSDAELLGRLLDRYRAYLHALAQRQIGGGLVRRVDASDIVQQTMLEAHRAFADFAGATEKELMAWLAQMLDNNLRENVRHHTRTAKRAIGREQSADSETVEWQGRGPARSSPSQRAIRSEEALRLVAALEQLPPDQREAVRLRHLENWSLNEIAEHLNRTPAAAAGLIKRGMQALRQRLPEPHEA